MINKELLEDKIIEFIKYNGGRMLFFNKQLNKNGTHKMSFAWEDTCINIYELAHKCKEWMKERECILSEFHHLDTVAVTIHINEERIYSTPLMTTYTESEAIFKACEYVMEQHK